MKPKIFWRLNALKGVGMGHLIRSLAAAKMLKDNFNNVFLIKTDSTKNIQCIADEGFQHFQLPTALSLQEEVAYLKEHHFTQHEIVVLDGYDFSSTYQREIKSLVGKLVCIDDMHSIYFVADAVINHSGGVSPLDYNCSPQTKLYLGPAYSLLRNVFLKRYPLSKERIASKAVLICLGGEDPQNDTLKVLEFCASIKSIAHCKVIVGSANKNLNTLKEYAKHSRLQLDFLQNLTAEEMLTIMRSSAKAICSPSTVALEYLSVGGNLFLYQTADNQKNIYRYLTNSQLAFPMSDWEEVSKLKLIKARENQQEIFDRKSPARITALFTALQTQIDIEFREAEEKDLQQYFHWANELETRQQSFNSQEITFLQHIKWYRNKLQCRNSLLVIMHNKEQPLGQVRFVIEDKIATLSFSLDKNSRGKGLAKQLVNGGIKLLQHKYPDLRKIHAFVKEANIPSKKSFAGLGFQEFKEESPEPTLKYIYHLNKTA